MLTHYILLIYERELEVCVGQSTPINVKSALQVHGRWARSKEFLSSGDLEGINRELIVRARFCETVINGVKRDVRFTLVSINEGFRGGSECEALLEHC